MTHLLTATLADGRTIEYFPDAIGEGAMKQVYFTADRTAVLCFYKNQSTAQDPNRRLRLEAIIEKYNPTTGNPTGDYWQKLFCWPTAIILQPQLGVMTPAYPQNYFFSSGYFTGKEKESTWFVKEKLQSMLPKTERGTWLNTFRICLLLARAIRRLHQAGLAHSDLSNNNVLVDPQTGQCLIIDIDSLVVPGLFPPDVLGTRGYIAPEVLSTVHLPLDHPKRQHPSTRTDLHALAVLIYQYLFLRHPLEGPKVNSTVSAEEDDLLSFGSQALFVENPQDTSNRPQDIQIPYTVLGPHLTTLFERAFIKGLHSPYDRPTALEWEKGLIKTWDLLFPCRNKKCPRQWFILDSNAAVKCPFCGTRHKEKVLILKLRSQRRPGQWLVDSQVAIYNNLSLFKWHVFDNVYPGEQADRTPQAYFTFYDGRWFLVNQQLTSLTLPNDRRVAPNLESGKSGQAVEVKEGMYFQLSQDLYGRIAEVKVCQP